MDYVIFESSLILNVKVLVGTFNQEKALVGAFSVIVQPVVEPMKHYTALILNCATLTDDVQRERLISPALNPDTEDDEDHHGGDGEDDGSQQPDGDPGLGQDHGGVRVLKLHRVTTLTVDVLEEGDPTVGVTVAFFAFC